ncbi:MAG: hypothetical protein ACRC92_25940 [Peptostreptococcaceae bacterium]
MRAEIISKLDNYNVYLLVAFWVIYIFIMDRFKFRILGEGVFNVMAVSFVLLAIYELSKV